MKTAVPLVWAILIGLLLLGASVVVKIYINAVDEFQAGEELLASGNPVKAIVHFERSIRSQGRGSVAWSPAPGAPVVEELLSVGLVHGREILPRPLGRHSGRHPAAGDDAEAGPDGAARDRLQ